MDKAPLNDPILTRFRAALDEAYGERLERAVLYGSRARGDARPDSDYDVGARPGRRASRAATLAKWTSPS